VLVAAQRFAIARLAALPRNNANLARNRLLSLPLLIFQEMFGGVGNRPMGAP
jgi:hypothetical protein